MPSYFARNITSIKMQAVYNYLFDHSLDVIFDIINSVILKLFKFMKLPSVKKIENNTFRKIIL